MSSEAGIMFVQGFMVGVSLMIAVAPYYREHHIKKYKKNLEAFMDEVVFKRTQRRTRPQLKVIEGDFRHGKL